MTRTRMSIYRQLIFYGSVLGLIMNSTIAFQETFVAAWGDVGNSDNTTAVAGVGPYGLVYESYVDGNWELLASHADGSETRNLTQTPHEHELYPQVSPDGQKICFVSDKGTGRDTVRSVWVMDLDGQNRRKVADHAREPCWSPDGRTIVYLPQEFPKFNVVDYYTKGLVYFDLEKGTSRPHPNSVKLHHLYNPSFAANGKWISATVHAGMGYGHANLLIEAEGERILDLGIEGCRTCLSPDGKHIAWGESDHDIVVADLDLNASEPRVGTRRFQVTDRKRKIYHVDWSPDSKGLSLSRGPDGKGDATKPGTHEAACEMMGVYAGEWDIYTVSLPADGTTHLDLNDSPSSLVHQVTKNGQSNKESDWFVFPNSR